MDKLRGKISRPVLAWLALLALTFASLVLGGRFGHAPWMPPLVAVVIWSKGTLVARHFIGTDGAHPFIVWLLRAFIGFAPAALVLAALLGK